MEEPRAHRNPLNRAVRLKGNEKLRISPRQKTVQWGSDPGPPIGAGLFAVSTAQSVRECPCSARPMKARGERRRGTKRHAFQDQPEAVPFSLRGSNPGPAAPNRRSHASHLRALPARTRRDGRKSTPSTMRIRGCPRRMARVAQAFG